MNINGDSISDIDVQTWSGRTQEVKNKDIVHAKDFGLIGDGSDEYEKIKNMFSMSASIYIFEKDKTYGISKQINIPANSYVITNGAFFKKLFGTSAHAVKLNSNTTIDRLAISCHINDDKNKGIWISGNNIEIGTLSVDYNYDGFAANGKWAVEIKSSDNSPLTNIKIKRINTFKASCAVIADNVVDLEINSGLSEFYRTAYYLKNVRSSTISNIVCRYTSLSSNGSPGENAFLIESNLEPFSTRNVTLNDCIAEDSGEHGFRLGGGYSAQNITYNRCISRRSGSSINIKNPNSNEWHGGCGFKILGNTSELGHRHLNVTFNQCIVEDVNETYGVYPEGHGVNNYAAWQIGCAVYVTLNSCTVRKTSTNTSSCSMAFEIIASDYIYINGGTFLDYRHYSRIYDADFGYIGWNLPSSHIFFRDALFSSKLNTVNMHFVVGTGKYAYKDICWMNCTFVGGQNLMRFTPLASGESGNWENCIISGRCEPNIKTNQLITGAASAIRTKDLDAPFNLNTLSSVKNGSTWRDSDSNILYTYAAGRWRITDLVLISVATNQVNSLEIPKDTGTCEIISASGDTMYLGIFYRSTMNPIANQMYATSTNNIRVSTVPLTGNTGEDGKVSVYVGVGTLNIENRMAIDRKFQVKFS